MQRSDKRKPNQSQKLQADIKLNMALTLPVILKNHKPAVATRKAGRCYLCANQI